MSDIDFDSAGNLYGVGSIGAQLYSINVGTGQAAVIGNAGFDFTQGGGLAVSPASVFYGTPQADNFGTYNSTLGTFTNIANPAKPAGGSYGALTFDGGTLYGINNGAASTKHIVTIVPATGAVTDIGATVTGLAGITFAAFGGGRLQFGRARRRRRPAGLVRKLWSRHGRDQEHGRRQRRLRRLWGRLPEVAMQLTIGAAASPAGPQFPSLRRRCSRLRASRAWPATCAPDAELAQEVSRALLSVSVTCTARRPDACRTTRQPDRPTMGSSWAGPRRSRPETDRLSALAESASPRLASCGRSQPTRLAQRRPPTKPSSK